MDLQVDAARVLLHNPGANPQRTLRYSAEQPEQQVTVQVTAGFEQQVMRADAVEVQAPQDILDTAFNSDASSMDTDTLTLPLRATGTTAEDTTGEDGQENSPRTVNTTVDKASSSVPGQTAELENAQGFELGWRGDDTGRIASVNLAAPTEASDENRAIIEKAAMKLLSLPVIFPEEAVGPGAVWSVDSRVTGEATLLQTATYTLNSLDGDKVELSVSVQQRPAQGALTMDSPEGTGSETLDVMNTNTTSTGTLRLNLSSPLPHSGEVALNTRVVYGQQGSEVRVVQDTATRLGFE